MNDGLYIGKCDCCGCLDDVNSLIDDENGLELNVCDDCIDYAHELAGVPTNVSMEDNI